MYKPRDGLVLLVAPHTRWYLQNFPGGLRGKHAPPAETANRNITTHRTLTSDPSPFVAPDNGIPGACAQGVDVNSGPRAAGAHHKPAVRGPAVLPPVLKQVVTEILGDRIVLQETTELLVLGGQGENIGV